MWRRIAVHLETLTPWKYASNLRSSGGGSAVGIRSLGSRQYLLRKVSCSEEVPSAFFYHLATSDADQILSKGKKRVEDIMPIATGHEREEIEAELEGRKRFDMDAPFGPFGTKEAPAEIQSYYDKRIVGCPGGEGEDEHDVVWFWLEKNKPHECPVCSQYFVLKVIGEGGPPDGHDDDGHH